MQPSTRPPRVPAGHEAGATGPYGVPPFLSAADLRAAGHFLQEDGRGWRMIGLAALFCTWAFTLGTLLFLYFQYPSAP